ncbi:MAG TPA: class I SAM-dependent methyltransferase [archaeon]|nr:class I SAM-dependent methyltransferase [archaeon]
MKCHICSAHDAGFFMKVRDFEFRDREVQLHKCAQCGIIFISPIPSAKMMEKYYSGQYYQKPSMIFSMISDLRKNLFSRERPGRVLDVGCGAGTFLEGMKSLGWNCHGTEVSESSKEFTRRLASKGIEIKYCDLKKAGFKASSFDLITFWQVLEHVQDPTDIIRYSARLLKKDGVLFISVPNIESAGFAVFSGNWFHLDVPRHIYHFSPASLSLLLGKNGFKVKEISQFSFEYAPFGLMQSFYNFLGFEFNLLYSMLKKKPLRKDAKYFIQFAVIILSVPLLFPIFAALGCLFAAMRRGEVVQIKASKA